MNLIVYIIIVLLIVAIALYVVFSILPIPETWKNVIAAIIMLLVVIAIIQKFGFQL